MEQLTIGDQNNGPSPKPQTIRLTVNEMTTRPIWNSSWRPSKSPVITEEEKATSTTDIAQTAVISNEAVVGQKPDSDMK